MSFKIIVIGVSKGGLLALKTVLSALPAAFPLPIVVVIHRAKDSDEGLSQLLQKVSSLTVVEVEDKQAILPGFVYLAPADYHLLIESDSLPPAYCLLPPAYCLLPPAYCLLPSTLPFPQQSR